MVLPSPTRTSTVSPLSLERLNSRVSEILPYLQPSAKELSGRWQLLQTFTSGLPFKPFSGRIVVPTGAFVSPQLGFCELELVLLDAHDFDEIDWFSPVPRAKALAMLEQVAGSIASHGVVGACAVVRARDPRVRFSGVSIESGVHGSSGVQGVDDVRLGYGSTLEILRTAFQLRWLKAWDPRGSASNAILVLKAWLREHGLADASTGGLSAFGLAMALFWVRMNRVSTKKNASAGELIIAFLDYFAYDHDSSLALHLTPPTSASPQPLHPESADTKIFDQSNITSDPLVEKSTLHFQKLPSLNSLTIIDPLDPECDVCASIHKWDLIQASFKSFRQTINIGSTDNLLKCFESRWSRTGNGYHVTSWELGHSSTSNSTTSNACCSFITPAVASAAEAEEVDGVPGGLAGHALGCRDQDWQVLYQLLVNLDEEDWLTYV